MFGTSGELLWVVGFQVCCNIGNSGKSNGMGFVETVTSELHNLFKYRFADFPRLGVCLKTFKEPLTEFAKILVTVHGLSSQRFEK
jgi:hypothetical protein